MLSKYPLFKELGDVETINAHGPYIKLFNLLTLHIGSRQYIFMQMFKAPIPHMWK